LGWVGGKVVEPQHWKRREKRKEGRGKKERRKEGKKEREKREEKKEKRKKGSWNLIYNKD